MNSDKFLKIKKWVGLDEAAERLTSIFEERITILDLIELGLSRDITLSVRLPYGEKFTARQMVFKEIPIVEHHLEFFLFRKICEKSVDKSLSKEDAIEAYEDEFKEYLQDEFYKMRESLSRNYGESYDEMTLETYLSTTKFGEYQYVTEPMYLNDVIYDLPMIGAEVLDVERIYSINKGYESKGLINIDGPFLQGKDGKLFNLMELFDDKEHNSCSNHLDAKSYYPADRLPNNSELGFRPESLIAFERHVSNASDVNNEGLNLLVGSMLNVLKNTNNKQKRWTQDLLKEEIVEASPHFTRRSLDDLFSDSNKAFKEKSM